MHPGHSSGSARTLSDLDVIWPTDEPPVSRLDSTDGSATCVFSCPPPFSAHVCWLRVVFTNTWPAASGEQLVVACPNLRGLNITASAMNFPLLTGPTGAPPLAGIQTFRFQSVALHDLSATDFVLVVDGLVAHMPALRDLRLGHSPRPDLQSAQADTTAVFPHIGRLALQRYEVTALFIHAGLPLKGSQDSIRELKITLDDQDGPTTRASLLTALESVTLRRLRHLVLVNRAAYLPLDFAPRLLAACPTVRTLELIIVRLSLDAYEWLDRALLVPGLRISALVVSPNVLFADKCIQTLVLHVQRLHTLRTLVLRCATPSDEADLVRLRLACRLRRILFTHQPE